MTTGTIELNENDVLCEVLTEREGMLSAVGHDLRIRARHAKWKVDTARGSLEGVIDAASLHVVNARIGEEDQPMALSAYDRERIDHSMHEEVLDTPRHHEVHVRATFRRDGDGLAVDGSVKLHGVERPFHAVARRDGEHWVASYRLDQTAFGLKPFSAMMGTLKVRRDVTVRVRVRAAAVPLEG